MSGNLQLLPGPDGEPDFQKWTAKYPANRNLISGTSQVPICIFLLVPLDRSQL